MIRKNVCVFLVFLVFSFIAAGCSTSAEVKPNETTATESESAEAIEPTEEVIEISGEPETVKDEARIQELLEYIHVLEDPVTGNVFYVPEIFLQDVKKNMFITAPIIVWYPQEQEYTLVLRIEDHIGNPQLVDTLVFRAGNYFNSISSYEKSFEFVDEYEYAYDIYSIMVDEEFSIVVNETANHDSTSIIRLQGKAGQVDYVLDYSERIYFEYILELYTLL